MDQPVTVERTGKPGRPRKRIDQAWLEKALSPSLKLSRAEVARELKVHYNTVKNYAAEYNINTSYSTMTDAELDELVRAYKLLRPTSGRRYAEGHIRDLGHRLQESRVHESLKRVDGLGNILRKNDTVKRRVYHVPRPNHLWHLDGHHKLILWGFVIHGVIDGYDRMVRSSMLSSSPPAECWL